MDGEKTGCPLCNAWKREPENVLWQNEQYALMRTKDLKGHRERLMILCKKHITTNHHRYKAIINTLPAIKEAFSYTYKAIIMDGKYGSIPDHWHLCVTDLEEGSKDHQQVMGTPWIYIVNVKEWKK